MTGRHTSGSERNGAHLRFQVAGDGDPPLVFVHGWCCDLTYFQPQFDYFKAAHTVVALDLPGFGGSSLKNHTLDVASFADDVAWLCGHLGIVKPVIVGHSLGAAVAIELGARHASLPAAVIAVEPGPIDPSPEIRELLVSLAEALQGPDAERVRTRYVQTMCFVPEDDQDRKTQISAGMCSVPIAVAASSLQRFLEWDGASALRACRAPLLVLLADIGPVHDATRLRLINRAVRIGVTVGAGHFHQLEVPEQVTPMIERFLRILGLAGDGDAPSRVRQVAEGC